MKYPKHYAKYRDLLTHGQMIPAPGLNDSIVFIVREQDHIVRKLKANALLHVSPVLVNSRNVQILYTLARFNNSPNMTYEAGFNMSMEGCRQDVESLIAQAEVPFAICGDKKWATIICTNNFAFQLQAVSEQHLQNPPTWSMSEFRAGLKAVQRATTNPADLWNQVQKSPHLAHEGISLTTNN